MFSQANDLASTVAHGYYDYYAGKYTGQILAAMRNWTNGGYMCLFLKVVSRWFSEQLQRYFYQIHNQR